MRQIFQGPVKLNLLITLFIISLIYLLLGNYLIYSNYQFGLYLLVIKINTRFIFAGLCLLILTISIILSIAEIQNKPGVYKFFYNNKFIPAVINISNYIPDTERLLVSHPHSYLNFFVSRQTENIPNGVTSEKSLMYYMVKNNISYVLIYDNRYFYPPNPMFTTNELKSFQNDFQEVVDYKIDNKLRLQLYRLNNNWTFQQ
jgi:hypothetical protein